MTPTPTPTLSLTRASRMLPAIASAPRREIKFALALADYGKLTSILKTNFRRVRHSSGDEPSVVSSLYFDDECFGAYRDSLDGTGQRRKVRLRWYNHDERTLFFEVKVRSFELVAKRRMALDASAPVSTLEYRTLLSELRRLLEPVDREHLERYARPVLLVDYARDYYEGDGVRVTVDTALRWFDQVGATRPRRRFGLGSRRLVVVEVKIPPRSPLSVSELLRPLRLAPTRSSKYVMGCERLGIPYG